MVAHIESILKYSSRFYNRQFLNRTVLSGTIISKFTEILKLYFESGNLQKHGLPTVKYMASQLSLSAGYLSDLLKQETGRTALDHIHFALINEAKNILMSTDNTVAETAFQLGFENPPIFLDYLKKLSGSLQLNIDTSF
jgi:AraC-like DNA-binding protein